MHVGILVFLECVSNSLWFASSVDPNSEIVPAVDSRHSASRQQSDAETESARAERVQAYLNFISELEAISPGLTLSEDVYNTGNTPSCLWILFKLTFEKIYCCVTLTVGSLYRFS